MAAAATTPFESLHGLLYQLEPEARPPPSNRDGGGGEWEIGTDEVARGCLFGSTYAAAVTLPPLAALLPSAAAVLARARDSKKVPRGAKMAALAADIRGVVRAYAVCARDAVSIDASNIREAVLAAMRQAVAEVAAQLPLSPDGGANGGACYVLADGRDLPSPVSISATRALPVVRRDRADARYVSVACASILAKAAHDAYILEWCDLHPTLRARYALDQNMGYGTAAHLAGLRQHGPTEWHRQSFRPCLQALLAAAAAPGTEATTVVAQRVFPANDDDDDDATELPATSKDKKRRWRSQRQRRIWGQEDDGDDGGDDDDD